MLHILNRLRYSIVTKVVGLLVLTLLLCIPLGRIDALNHERGQAQNEAAEELASTYTGPQTVTGPMLVVPYVERWTETMRNSSGKEIGRTQRSEKGQYLLFPASLHIEGELAPRERYRGIFKIPFYALDARLNGNFEAFDTASIPHANKASRVETGTPYLVFRLSDLRGLEGSPTVMLAGTALRFLQRAPGLSDAVSANAVHATLEGAALADWRAGKPLAFDMKLDLVGQTTLSMVPVADETTAHLRSSWAHPRFEGRFLATERKVDASGFDARWRVSSLVSSAQDQVLAEFSGSTAATSGAVTTDAARTSMVDVPQTFNVALAQPLNVYSVSTRAGKYGALFIGLVLMAAFMFELFRGLRLHPVQYSLVGLSIALFFLLLLALSEKLAFAYAYAVAASASVLLLAAYFSAVLGGWRRGVSFGMYVAILYAALYGLLTSESNALLLGSLLIFGMLSLLMLATRRVDWYRLSHTERAEPTAEQAAPTSSIVS